MAELVGKRYATSLFDVAVELNGVDDFQSQLKFIKDTLIDQEGILKILEHPRISRKEKKVVVDKIFGQYISKEILNFLFIIIDKRREESIVDIVKEFNTLFKDYKNILDIEAITAVEMNEKSKNRLKLVLKDKFHKEINLSNTIDPSIIGGVLLRMDEQIIDSTLKSQLKEMETMIQSVSI